jgi:hypothetical protein
MLRIFGHIILTFLTGGAWIVIYLAFRLIMGFINRKR